jgi:hypothetical protein
LGLIAGRASSASARAGNASSKQNKQIPHTNCFTRASFLFVSQRALIYQLFYETVERARESLDFLFGF